MAPSRGIAARMSESVGAWNARAGSFVLEGGCLWWSGCKEACQLQKCLVFFLSSKTVLRNSVQCFLLNGVIFLGSIALLDHALVPATKALLAYPARLLGDATGLGEGAAGGAAEDVFGATHEFMVAKSGQVVVGLYNVMWLYPAYAISFVANCIWYNDIANEAFQISQSIAEKRARRKAAAAGAGAGAGAGAVLQPSAAAGGGGRGRAGGGGAGPSKESVPGFGAVAMAVGSEVYRVILFLVFVTQVFMVSLVPYVGQPLYLLLLSWLYAYYCYDYSWGMAGWPLERRLAFVECNWAFFAGFGFPCVVTTAFFSTFVSAGVMALVFPLFVLVATPSDPAMLTATVLANAKLIHQDMPRAELQERLRAPMGRVRMFKLAHAQTTWLVRALFPRPGPRKQA